MPPSPLWYVPLEALKMEKKLRKGAERVQAGQWFKGSETDEKKTKAWRVVDPW